MTAIPLRFFLGGHDLEMAVIAGLIRAECCAGALADKNLAWGARASAYRDEIAQAAAGGLVPVLVELAPDIALPEGAIEIDHHDDRAGGPCSLRQVFDLLGLPEARWSRYFAFVAANDTGHVAGMRAIGASEAEIAAIRAADRRAQGITPAEEEAGRKALAAARRAFDGALVIVSLPHGRSATVTDPLALSGENPAPEILVLMPNSVGYFGAGPAIAASRRMAGRRIAGAGFLGRGRQPRGGGAFGRACAGSGPALRHRGMRRFSTYLSNSSFRLRKMATLVEYRRKSIALGKGLRGWESEATFRVPAD